MTALGQKQTSRTLESLHDQHASAVAAGKSSTASPLRMAARRLAAKLGVEAPDWAAKQPLGQKPPTPKPATVKPVERAALPATVAEYITQPVELPASLREWAAAGDRALRLSPLTGAVTLVRFSPRSEARFPSEAAALAALAAPDTIAWRAPGAGRGSPWRGRPRAA